MWHLNSSIRGFWWGKCYSLKSLAERRDNFDDKAHSGFLEGYAIQNTRYLDIEPLLDRIKVSVHVMFNAKIPNPIEDYPAELDRIQIEVASESRNPVDCAHLVGTHDQDSLVYETTRVGLLWRTVGWCRLRR